MSDDTEFTLVADDGNGSAKETSVNPAESSTDSAVKDVHDGVKSEASKEQPKERTDDSGTFKARLDRMRRKEREKYEAESARKDAEWERRFAELKASIGAGKPKEIDRKDYSSDNEYMEARKKDAMDKLFAEFDSRQKAKADAEAEEKRKQDEVAQGYKKFAQKFHERMQATMTDDEQKRVMAIANDRNSAVNVAMSSSEGKTLQGWLMEECENPAKVISYLEDHEDQMNLLMTLSARKQLQQLDILDMHLSKMPKAGANSDNTEQRPKPTVMGSFGGTTQPSIDDSQKSDTERVANLIKAMRRR